jgi:multiple sugar transport system permease protein
MPDKPNPGWLFVAPAQLALGIVVFLPAVYIFWLSFYDSSFGQSPIFVGLDNYAGVLGDPYFWHALLNTVLLVAVIVHLEVLVGLGMALLFNSGVPGSRFMLAAVMAPYAVSEVSAVVIWRFMLDSQIGPVSQFLSFLGAGPIEWSVNPWQALGIVAVMTIWLNLPFTFIILYAARVGLGGEIYEAASIDGASEWQSFRRITLPLLKPAILVAVIFRYIFSFRLFSEVWLLTQGGPARSTEVVALYLYQEAFRYHRFGVASATAWLMVLAAFILASFYLRRLYREMTAYG